LEQHALAGLERAARLITQSSEVLAQHLDPATIGAHQAQ
jgi:hypothetical protein